MHRGRREDYETPGLREALLSAWPLVGTAGAKHHNEGGGVCGSESCVGDPLVSWSHLFSLGEAICP